MQPGARQRAGPAQAERRNHWCDRTRRAGPAARRLRYEGGSRNHQEASQNVEAHHEAHAENKNAQKDDLREELFRKVRRVSPASANYRQDANKKQEKAKPCLLDSGGDEGSDDCNVGCHFQTAEQRSSKNRGCRKYRIKILPEGNVEVAMHGWPMR